MNAGPEAGRNAYRLPCLLMPSQAPTALLLATRPCSPHSLLRKNKPEDPIEVFRWNPDAYPLSPNVHDSLAEALLASGDREGARAG